MAIWGRVGSISPVGVSGGACTKTDFIEWSPMAPASGPVNASELKLVSFIFGKEMSWNRSVEARTMRRRSSLCAGACGRCVGIADEWTFCAKAPLVEALQRPNTAAQAITSSAIAIHMALVILLFLSWSHQIWALDALLHLASGAICTSF